MRLLIFAILAGFVLSCGNHPQVVKTRRQPDQIATLATGGQSRTDAEAEAESSLKEGLAMFRTGNYARAQVCFERSLDEDYRDWKAHYYLGLALRHQDLPDEALAALHHGLRLAPEDPRTRSRIYVAIGEVSESTGEIGQARLSYMTALKIWPESDSAKDGLARLDNRELSAGR